MNRLSLEKRIHIVNCLVEGLGIRPTSRLVGVQKHTIIKLIRDLGEMCSVYHDKTMRNIITRNIEVDELWFFVYAKQRNAHNVKRKYDVCGTHWTWVAIDADSKLVIQYMNGDRSEETAKEFMLELRSRINGTFNLRTDKYIPYVEAVFNAFGGDINYATRGVTFGSPDPFHVSTSYVERQNLTLRTHNRRYTRHTNGHSKSLENHEAMLAIFYMYYNFVRIYTTTKTTPAIEAGITKRLWATKDLVELLSY